MEQRDLHHRFSILDHALLQSSLRLICHRVLITSACKKLYHAMGTGVLCNPFLCFKLLHCTEKTLQQHGLEESWSIFVPCIKT